MLNKLMCCGIPLFSVGGITRCRYSIHKSVLIAHVLHSVHCSVRGAPCMLSGKFSVGGGGRLLSKSSCFVAKTLLGKIENCKTVKFIKGGL